jgi:hypothetical protein
LIPLPLPARFQNLNNLLGVSPSECAELLLQEPRLLLPKVDVVTRNHQQLQQRLGLSADDLRSWLVRVPELLLVSSDIVGKRLKLLPTILWQVSAKARAEHKVSCCRGNMPIGCQIEFAKG